MCTRKVTRRLTVDSTIYEGAEVDGFTVRYDTDGSCEDYELEEIRPLVVIGSEALRRDVISGLKPAFDYLNNRLLGDCNRGLEYTSNLQMFKMFRIFDPARAVDLRITAADIDALGDAFPILKSANLLAGMKLDLPKYLQLGIGFATNRSHMREYTKDILRFWRQHGGELNDAWKFAARCVFSIPGSSAASERVFSLLKTMYPEQRGNALADNIEASLMLRYNKRLV
eukprot:COSAG02_NODE_1423_length_12684_cov_35.530393_2_plen_227_part_00